ncbi:MAG: ribonuclease H-like domain-containing protein [Lachnospiraceae bacterium]|nr:ribonuclease H-like domain-containing protein [Lachnospiraceae bacterium]
MKTWTETIPINIPGINTQEAIPGMSLPLEDTLFFDIETTGFKAEYCNIYMIGCATFAKDSATITLLFAEHRHEEKALLEAFSELLCSKNQCFTFNGNHFDIPFIEKRATKHGVTIDFTTMPAFDLYLYIKSFRHLIQLDHYKQKDLENYLGIHREDIYNGGELIPIYKAYDECPNEEGLQLLKQHNFDDVKGMLRLLPLLQLGYLYRKDNYVITNMQNIENEIVFQGTLQYGVPKPIIYRQEHLYLKLYDCAFQGILYPKKQTMRYYYENYKDYIYLPAEDMIIPKVLADTIPKSEKQRATKENCCVKKDSFFLPLPTAGYIESFSQHLFQESYKSKERYIDCSDISWDTFPIISYLIAYLKA